MWKWDGGNFTWIGGSGESAYSSYYGDFGTFSADFFPRSRHSAAVAVVSTETVLIFGGCVSGFNSYENDLWAFHLVGEFALLSSPDGVEGVYPSKGSATAASVPGKRNAAAYWTGSNGEIFLFGGWGFVESSGNGGPLNDMWSLGCDVGYSSLRAGLCAIPSDIPDAPIAGGSYWAYLSGSSQKPGGGQQSMSPGFDDMLRVPTAPGRQSYPGFTKDSDGTCWLAEANSARSNVFTWDGSVWTLAYNASTKGAVYSGEDPHPVALQEMTLWPRTEGPGFVMFGGAILDVYLSR